MHLFVAGLSAVFALTSASAAAAEPALFLVTDRSVLLDAAVERPSPDLARVSFSSLSPASGSIPGRALRLRAEIDCAGSRVRIVEAVVADTTLAAVEDQTPRFTAIGWRPVEARDPVDAAVHAYACRGDAAALTPLPPNVDLKTAAEAFWAATARRTLYQVGPRNADDMLLLEAAVERRAGDRARVWTALVFAEKVAPQRTLLRTWMEFDCAQPQTRTLQLMFAGADLEPRTQTPVSEDAVWRPLKYEGEAAIRAYACRGETGALEPLTQTDLAAAARAFWGGE